VWHFIIGVDIIKKYSYYFLFTLLIFSCAGISKINKKSKVTIESKIKVQTQYWNMTSDSINLYTHIALPLNRFVFKKQRDHFAGEIIFTLVISDAENNSQIHRESWREKISEPYYENTRDPDNYFKTERNIALLPGTYKLFLNVQDEDSRKNWKINKKLTLDRVNYISPSLLFIKENDGQMKQVDFLIQKMDTIWLRTQINFPNDDTLSGPVIEKSNQIDSNKDIEFFVIHKEAIIDSGKVKITHAGIQNLYYLPIPIIQHNKGSYKIELRYLDDKQTTSFYYGFKTKNYWTDELDEVIGVMRYILPYSEYKQLKGKDESEKWEAINIYWKEKDPSPETDENELLNELNERVRFSNKNFSILMHGWRSDRGRIYIIYGEPQIVDETYRDNRGYNYQKWVYANGKEFLFIDRTMSGDYTLHHERF
jgi:GWxTD domain-containing protein|tara:strand:+ start:2637 stop:3908 length:1272 start_codon:yes stop_codon:yes gene_type:complete